MVADHVEVHMGHWQHLNLEEYMRQSNNVRKNEEKHGGLDNARNTHSLRGVITSSTGTCMYESLLCFFLR